MFHIKLLINLGLVLLCVQLTLPGLFAALTPIANYTGWDATAKLYKITLDPLQAPATRHVPAGIDVQLFCQLAQPKWFYNDAAIGEQQRLLLPTVQATAAGLYSCQTQSDLHGFKWANLTLHVGFSQQHAANDDITDMQKFDASGDSYEGLAAASSSEDAALQAESAEDSFVFRPLPSDAMPPKFRQSGKLPTLLQRTEGGLLQLSCAAFGNPLPNITWYCNDTQLPDEPSARHKHKKWTLQLEALTPADAGRYKCRLCNKLGCVEHTTEVSIMARVRLAPYIRDDMPQNLTVPVNENAKFECPVVSDLEPYIIWVKLKASARSIDAMETELLATAHVADLGDRVERLVTSEYEPQVLRLGSVQPEDAGWYTCVVANSLGRALASAYLTVRPSESLALASAAKNVSLQQNQTAAASGAISDAEHENAEGDNDRTDATNASADNAKESTPAFNKQLVSLIHKPSGSSVLLNCPARGYPTPNISWSINGSEIMRHIGKVTYKKWSMHMEDVITQDSGVYTCKLCNPLGCIKHDFKLLVNDRLRSKPIHSDRYPQNQTVLVNSSVNFECKVVSDLEPLIWWIRYKQRNKTKEELESSVPQGSFNFSEHFVGDFVKLPTDPDRTNLLQLVNVTHADEGWYSCIAANSLGESKASAYLMVVDKLPTREVYTLLRSHPIWITVAAVVVVLLFLLGSVFIIYVLRKLKHEKLLKHRIETVHQWTKKVIIYKPPSAENSACDLQMPVIKIEKQRTTFQTSSSVDAFNEYEFPLDSNWEIERTQLVLGSTLGEGAFGRVVMAEACALPRAIAANNASTIVAVKMVKDEHTDADMASLVREMEVMKMIGKHINIINLLGCCSQSGPLWVIVEYAPYGNLKDFLKKNRPTSTLGGTLTHHQRADGFQQAEHKLTEKNLISFAFQIARGMEYLASRRCIHRDLAARNVLVSDNYVIKIADFGLARDIQDTDYYRKNTNGRLPIKWMAPESLQEKFYDSQSDVWSYGVLLWEIMTYGEQPYPNIMSAEELYGYLITGQRMEKPARCSLNIYMLMRQCWHFDATARPTFVELVENLDKILQLANSMANEEYLDLSMPMLETPPSSSYEEDSDVEPFQETAQQRYQYTYKFN